LPLDALLDDHDGLALADLIRRGEVSPLELLEAVIARIEARDPAVNAVVHRAYDEARAELAKGALDGPFAGLPFLVKDLYSFRKGWPCGNGSRWLADYRAPFDDPMVARWRDAGLIVLGKTATSEFGLNVSTETRQHGATRNPWAPDRSPGGSSGGAAAAVAAGMLPMAHASDGGGSIRIPAACCGLFGLKPSRGRNPTSDAWAGLAVFHAVTRSVRDSAVLLDAICGPPGHHPYSLPKPQTPFLQAVGRDPVGQDGGRLRIAWTTRTPEDVELHPECRAAVVRAAALASELGHEVVEADPEIDHVSLRQTMITIVAANMADALGPGNPLRPEGAAAEDVETISWRFAERGAVLPAADYLRAQARVRAVGERLAGFMRDYDLLMTPTMAQPAPPLGLLDTTLDDFDGFNRAVRPYVAFTQMFNMSGQPAASLPLHWTPEGLPVGVQVAAKVGDEAVIFALSGQLEAAQPWFHRRPST